MRIQFSLRNLLIAILLLSIPLGVGVSWRNRVVSRTNRHCRARELLSREIDRVQAGRIFDVTSPPSLINSLDRLAHPQANERTDFITAPEAFWTKENTRLLKDLCGLVRVYCAFHELTDEHADSLCDVPELANLYIRWGKKDDDALIKVLRMPTLRHVDVDDDCDESVFVGLRDHPSLEYLAIRSAIPISSANAAKIKSIPHLRSLTLEGAEYDSKILVELCSDTLQFLCADLASCDIASLKPLKNTSLTSLMIACSAFPNETLATLAAIPKLESLSLSGQLQIDDSELEAIASCQNLKSLRLPNAKFSLSQWKALSKLPNLQFVVTADPEDAERVIEFEKSAAGRQHWN
jgi:hypothetical protein